MNYAALVPALTFALVLALLILTAYLILEIHSLQGAIMSFRTDADAAIAAAKAAIDAIPSRIPPPTDPATIVPVADQTAVLSGISSLKTEADSILAAPTPPPV